MTNAALLVTDLVERQHHLFGDPCAFLQDSFDNVRTGVGKAGKIHVALISEHIVENEKRIVDRSLEDWHGSSSLVVASPRAR